MRLRAGAALAASVLACSIPSAAPAQDPTSDAISSAVAAAFEACASAYRASMTGKSSPDGAFDCVIRSAEAGDLSSTTLSMNVTYSASNRAGLAYIEELQRDAVELLHRNPDAGYVEVAYIRSLMGQRESYADALCRLHAAYYTSGTARGPVFGSCKARQLDQQIGDLMILLKEYGVIPNGR